MADIDVVPKRRSSTWLWIILAVVAVLIVMMMMGVFSNDGASRVGAVIERGPAVAAVPTLTT